MKTFKGVPVPPIDEILERTIYVKKKNTEIERLAAELDELRKENELLRQNLDRVSNIGLDCAEEAADLAAKLEAAQAELHDLRIRVGLGEGGPDWSQAPEWAQWWAVDEDGASYWYENKPTVLINDGIWNNPSGRTFRADSPSAWVNSLRERPVGNKQ